MTRTQSAREVGVEALLAAFAEPTRLQLLALVADGETCVCDLVGALELPQPAVSRHLSVLRRAGLVTARRDGRWMWYRLAPGGSRLARSLLACLRECRDEIPGLERAAQRCARLRAGPRCC